MVEEDWEQPEKEGGRMRRRRAVWFSTAKARRKSGSGACLYTASPSSSCSSWVGLQKSGSSRSQAISSSSSDASNSDSSSDSHSSSSESKKNESPAPTALPNTLAVGELGAPERPLLEAFEEMRRAPVRRRERGRGRSWVGRWVNEAAVGFEAIAGEEEEDEEEAGDEAQLGYISISHSSSSITFGEGDLSAAVSAFARDVRKSSEYVDVDA